MGGSIYKSNANEKYHFYCSSFMADHKLLKETFHAKIALNVSQTMELNGVMLKFAHSMNHETIPLKFLLNKAYFYVGIHFTCIVGLLL